MKESELLRSIDTRLEELEMAILYGDSKSSLIKVIEDTRQWIRWQLEEDRA